MRIVFMGTPEFSIPTLERLISSKYDIVAVYTQPDRVAGRGKRKTMPPVKQISNDRGIPTFQPVSFKERSEIETLMSHDADAIVLVAYGQMLPQEVLDIPKFGCLNVHPSLLPKYRGASPVVASIIAGDDQTGASIMLMDAGMDTGPILSQRMIPIDSRDTTESLEVKLAHVGADLLVETLPKWFEQKLVPERQDNREAVYTEQISKKDGEIDWWLSSVELERRVRAFYPWPGCYTYWQGKSLKVLEAVALPAGDQLEQGVVVALSSDPQIPVGVGTGNGILGLSRLQLEGKKANLSSEFVRGQKDFIGARLGR